MSDIEALLTELELAAGTGLYFEVDSEDAERLLQYIRELEAAADDDRGVL